MQPQEAHCNHWIYIYILLDYSSATSSVIPSLTLHSVLHPSFSEDLNDEYTVIVRKLSSIYLFTAFSFKVGKDNITTVTPGLFACKKIFFPTPFNGEQQVKVLASFGHATESQAPRNGAALWVEGVKNSEFTVCIVEFGGWSNKTAEVNWISYQSALPGSQIGTTLLKAWTGEKECKRVYFQQV